MSGLPRPAAGPPARAPRGGALLARAALGCAALALAGCAPPAGPPPVAGPSRPATATSPSAGSTPPASASAPATSPAAAPCQAPGGFSCTMAARIRLVQQYLAGRPGQIGIVLHDRQTGATWRNPAAGRDFPAASTAKLAMVTDLLLRNGAGQIHLGGGDWSLIDAALHVSSDHAADLLWQAYEGAGFLQRIQGFGMGSASYTTPGAPYWGFMYCSASDLDSLMNYVLGRIPAGARLYLTRHLQHVAPIQQWGVWGGGPASHPGNKDGWEDDSGTWITNTVGFAGPGARYTLAIMYDTAGARGFHYGTVTLSEVAALLFQGHPGPEPTVTATP